MKYYVLNNSDQMATDLLLEAARPEDNRIT